MRLSFATSLHSSHPPTLPCSRVSHPWSWVFLSVPLEQPRPRTKTQSRFTSSSISAWSTTTTTTSPTTLRFPSGRGRSPRLNPNLPSRLARSRVESMVGAGKRYVVFLSPYRGGVRLTKRPLSLTVPDRHGYRSGLRDHVRAEAALDCVDERRDVFLLPEHRALRLEHHHPPAATDPYVIVLIRWLCDLLHSR